ncbi:MAG: flgG [Gemmataceae bacterium]|nr:flgG [Gemmataceae bacterium]
MLFASLYTSGSGVQAASSYLDITGNNIANATTTGFKTVEAGFQDFLYNGLITGGANRPGQTPPGGIQVGSGAALTSTEGVFTQGPLTPTGHQFDLAINGKGFFQVTLPDGSTALTRDGSFNRDSNGQLVTSQGFLLNPPITVPPGTSSVGIASDGTVTAVTQSGTQTLGQITLTDVRNPAGLLRVGSNLYTASPASGPPQAGTPGTGVLGTLSQSTLEGSNVDISTELVHLIIAQGAFLYNSQALLASNETLADTTAQLFP